MCVGVNQAVCVFDDEVYGFLFIYIYESCENILYIFVMLDISIYIACVNDIYIYIFDN
jgi:hypothetical protein